MQDVLLLQRCLPEDSLGSDGGWPSGVGGVQARDETQGAADQALGRRKVEHEDVHRLNIDLVDCQLKPFM